MDSIFTEEQLDSWASELFAYLFDNNNQSYVNKIISDLSLPNEKALDLAMMKMHQNGVPVYRGRKSNMRKGDIVWIR